jgi:peptide/nickel transport system substrate-binding protein
MTSHLRRISGVAPMSLLIFLVACAPQASNERSGGGPQDQSRPSGPKVLTIATQREPSDLGSFTATSGIRGANTATVIVHNSLASEDEREARRPELAAELPTVDRGTWRVNADGTMETIWRLRPNVTWQDGAPFTSADLLFSFEVYKDPDIPNSRGRGVPLMNSASTPDPLTFTIHWSKTYADADSGTEMLPMPRHLLDELYRTDKAAFANARYFTTDFVGLGPYRLVGWESGSHMEFERFDQYFRGRPPLDRVVLRFVSDPNTMIANILSDAVDVVLPPNVDYDVLFEVQRRWEGTGNVARADPTGRFRLMDPQHRAEYARPTNGVTNQTVRQALYQAVDRSTIVDVLTQGLSPVADSWIPPDHWLRPHVEGAIPQYPYSPSRAQQLLATAGWTPGPDGVLIHSQTREPFDLVLRLANAGGASAGKEREANIIRDNWQDVGIRVQIDPIPAARSGDRQYEATVPGLSLTGNLAPQTWFTDRTHSKSIASEANRWNGGNKAGYTNPRVDDILDKLLITIDRNEQAVLHRQLIQEQMGDVALLPLYWESAPIFMVKGVNHDVVGARTGYRFHEWDKQS